MTWPLLTGLKRLSLLICPQLTLSGKAYPQVVYKQLPAIKWLHSGRLEVLKIKVSVSQYCCLERLSTGQESPLMSHSRKQSVILSFCLCLCCLCVFVEGRPPVPQTGLHSRGAPGAFQTSAQHGTGLHYHHRLCGGCQARH